MSMDINLLPSRAKFQATKIRLKKNVTIFMWVFTTFWFVVIGGVLGVYFVTNAQLNSANKNFESEVSQYKSLSGDASVSYQIKYRAKLVGKVLNDRFEYGKSIKKVTSIFSNDITLINYEIKGVKLFSIMGSVDDGRKLEEVERKIKEINAGDLPDFVSAQLTAVGINIDNSWNFTMEVRLK